MTSHRPPTRILADRTRPLVWGPSGQLGPVRSNEAANMKRPAAVSSVEVTARATGWQKWSTVETLGRIG